MADRPDYVKCVSTGRFLRSPSGDPVPEKMSWCGLDVTHLWAFVDAGHAALAAPRSNLVPCPECVSAIKRSLDGEEVLPRLP
jgi:hypothetical protein